MICFISEGIPWDATEKQIRGDFGECGEIEDLAMPNKTVFITYKTKAGADKALEYDGDQYGKGTLQASKGCALWRGTSIHHNSSSGWMALCYVVISSLVAS